MQNYDKLKSAGISLPTWIHAETFITNILTLEGQELYSVFGFNDSTSCTKFLTRYIPGKPKNMKFSKYLRSIIDVEVEDEDDIDVEDEVVLEAEVEDDIDVEFTKRQDNFMTIYKKGFFNKALIAALSEEDKKAYEIFASSMRNSENYKE